MMVLAETTPFRFQAFSDRTAAIYALSRTTRLAVLTWRQVEVAWLVADGMSDKQIAAELSITRTGVHSHMTRIGDRLHVNRGKNTRVQIAREVILAWSEIELAA